MKPFPIFLFSDLDDTLFQSRRKCPPGGELQPVAFLRDGGACSFMTPAQRAFFEFARDTMRIIPTTARNLDAFRRVDLPFTSYAILDYGGVIMEPDGRPDPTWQRRMHDALRADLPVLQELARLIDAHAERTGFGGRVRMVEDFGMPYYLVLKDPDKNGANLLPFVTEVIRPWTEAGRGDYVVHVNDNNLAILPPSVNKAHAVAYLAARLRREHGEIITFGIGDSLSDARFLAQCDYPIVPARTQLSQLALGAP